MSAALRVEGRAPFVAGSAVPGDKSITHRAFLLSALAARPVRIEGALRAADTRSSLAAIEALGSAVWQGASGVVEIAPAPWRPPADAIDCGNSGTTMRLLSGLLAATPGEVVLTGDESLRRRPMRRITRPLEQMGASIESHAGCAPLRVRGGPLREGTRHRLEVASAQVKSAILLAALRAGVGVALHEPGPARDHTERMLAAAGRAVRRNNDGWLELDAGPATLALPATLVVPGDLSSAAFLFVAAAITAGRVRVPGVGINPTRAGVLEALRRAGARVVVEAAGEMAGEPVATVTVEGGELRPFELAGDEVVRSIDELPALAVLAAVAPGCSEIRDAAELRVKESDRIAGICAGLSAFGAAIEERPDGFVVRGGRKLRGATVDPRGDHRLAMAFAVAGLAARGETHVRDAECIDVSFPGFGERVGAVTQEGER